MEKNNDYLTELPDNVAAVIDEAKGVLLQAGSDDSSTSSQIEVLRRISESHGVDYDEWSTEIHTNLAVEMVLGSLTAKCPTNKRAEEILHSKVMDLCEKRGLTELEKIVIGLRWGLFDGVSHPERETAEIMSEIGLSSQHPNASYTGREALQVVGTLRPIADELYRTAVSKLHPAV